MANEASMWRGCTATGTPSQNYAFKYNTGAVDNGGIVDDGSYVDDTTYTDPGVAPDQTYDQGVGGDANGTGDAVADDGTYTDQAA